MGEHTEDVEITARDTEKIPNIYPIQPRIFRVIYTEQDSRLTRLFGIGVNACF